MAKQLPVLYVYDSGRRLRGAGIDPMYEADIYRCVGQALAGLRIRKAYVEVPRMECPRDLERFYDWMNTSLRCRFPPPYSYAKDTVLFEPEMEGW